MMPFRSLFFWIFLFSFGYLTGQAPEVSRQINAADSLRALGKNTDAVRLLQDVLSSDPSGKYTDADLGALHHKIGVYQYINGELKAAFESVSNAIGFRQSIQGTDLANSYYLRSAIDRELRNLSQSK